jgi:hypothetical protein
MSYIATTATNHISCCCYGEWRNAVGSTERFARPSSQVKVHYDRRADVLSVTMREGEPKYVVGRGTFVIFADDEGVWSIDLEAESWDSDADAVFPLMRIEVW